MDGKRGRSPSPIQSSLSDLKISDDAVLHQAQDRTLCTHCDKTVKYFCYRCFQVLGCDREKIPTVKLPVPLDVIKHERELDGKSTAVHARIIAPDDVHLYGYNDIPEYEHPERTLLLFPGPDAKTLKEIPRDSFDRIVVLDGTWKQANRMAREAPQLQKLQKITIEPRNTLFWRFQHMSENYLATIEAIYYTYREFADAYEPEDYRGQYDNLLFYYRFFYNLIQTKYKANKRLKFNHRHANKNYIKYEGKDAAEDHSEKDAQTREHDATSNNETSAQDAK
ncbi:DTW-domain-containing protein [Hesseltinella vesiculosa]|uniref:tRNA-uridine aminocarboxypropyltransferase 1 n=1 Tax=Hesseltinella vesiculosa TaxID=101127 RepID=A0A1X2G5S8_9FUNG|nr:DTW-domain-containing protein [Hesseltinella vesiculosa]